MSGRTPRRGASARGTCGHADAFRTSRHLERARGSIEPTSVSVASAAATALRGRGPAANFGARRCDHLLLLRRKRARLAAAEAGVITRSRLPGGRGRLRESQRAAEPSTTSGSGSRNRDNKQQRRQPRGESCSAAAAAAAAAERGPFNTRRRVCQVVAPALLPLKLGLHGAARRTACRGGSLAVGAAGPAARCAAAGGLQVLA
eukprot:350592-Chlamydomonas_euryale.AAC.2